MARADVPALTLSHLSWVQQNYLWVETLTVANARPVDTRVQLPLAQAWGGGEVASADGLYFVVPVRTIHAGWNCNYFGSERGVTYYTFISDQFTGFHDSVIPGTLRDSLVILAGLLEQQTSLDPREIMAYTHGYSKVVFGLFSLLGYRFSTRLADLLDQRFWHLQPTHPSRAQPGRGTARRGPGRLPRQKGRAAPALPRGHGGPVGNPRAGRQRLGAVKYALA